MKFLIVTIREKKIGMALEKCKIVSLSQPSAIGKVDAVKYCFSLNIQNSNLQGNRLSAMMTSLYSSLGGF